MAQPGSTCQCFLWLHRREMAVGVQGGTGRWAGAVIPTQEGEDGGSVCDGGGGGGEKGSGLRHITYGRRGKERCEGQLGFSA